MSSILLLNTVTLLFIIGNVPFNLAQNGERTSQRDHQLFSFENGMESVDPRQAIEKFSQFKSAFYEIMDSSVYLQKLFTISISESEALQMLNDIWLHFAVDQKMEISSIIQKIALASEKIPCLNSFNLASIFLDVVEKCLNEQAILNLENSGILAEELSRYLEETYVLNEKNLQPNLTLILEGMTKYLVSLDALTPNNSSLLLLIFLDELNLLPENACNIGDNTPEEVPYFSDYLYNKLPMKDSRIYSEMSPFQRISQDIEILTDDIVNEANDEILKTADATNNFISEMSSDSLINNIQDLKLFSYISPHDDLKEFKGSLRDDPVASISIDFLENEYAGLPRKSIAVDPEYSNILSSLNHYSDEVSGDSRSSENIVLPKYINFPKYQNSETSKENIVIDSQNSKTDFFIEDNFENFIADQNDLPLIEVSESSEFIEAPIEILNSEVKNVQVAPFIELSYDEFEINHGEESNNEMYENLEYVDYNEREIIDSLNENIPSSEENSENFKEKMEDAKSNIEISSIMDFVKDENIEIPNENSFIDIINTKGYSLIDLENFNIEEENKKNNLKTEIMDYLEYQYNKIPTDSANIGSVKSMRYSSDDYSLENSHEVLDEESNMKIPASTYYLQYQNDELPNEDSIFSNSDSSDYADSFELSVKSDDLKKSFEDLAETAVQDERDDSAYDVEEKKDIADKKQKTLELLNEMSISDSKAALKMLDAQNSNEFENVLSNNFIDSHFINNTNHQSSEKQKNFFRSSNVENVLSLVEYFSNWLNLNQKDERNHTKTVNQYRTDEIYEKIRSDCYKNWSISKTSPLMDFLERKYNSNEILKEISPEIKSINAKILRLIIETLTKKTLKELGHSEFLPFMKGFFNILESSFKKITFTSFFQMFVNSIVRLLCKEKSRMVERVDLISKMLDNATKKILSPDAIHDLEFISNAYADTIIQYASFLNVKLESLLINFLSELLTNV